MTELHGSLQKRTRPAGKHDFLKGLAVMFVPFAVVLVLARVFHWFASFMVLVSAIILATALIAVVFFRKGYSVALASLILLLVFHHLFSASISPQEKVKIAAERRLEDNAKKEFQDEVPKKQLQQNVKKQNAAAKGTASLASKEEEQKQLCEQLADPVAEKAREWTHAQVAPFVPDFDWGQYIGRQAQGVWVSGSNGDYQDWCDDEGGLHERFGFKMLNGSVRRTTYCYLSPDRKTFRCSIWND